MTVTERKRKVKNLLRLTEQREGLIAQLNACEDALRDETGLHIAPFSKRQVREYSCSGVILKYVNATATTLSVKAVLKQFPSMSPATVKSSLSRLAGMGKLMKVLGGYARIGGKVIR